MSLINKLTRGALAVGTMGLSETDAGKRVGQSLGLSKPDVVQASVDTSALDPEKQRAQDAYYAFLQQANNQGYSAPQIKASQTEAVQPVSAIDPGNASSYMATAVGAPDKVSVTGLPAQAAGVQSMDVAAPGVNTYSSGGAQVNDAQGQEIRGQQLGYLNNLKAAAEGRGPSVADAAFKEHLADVNQAQMGAVAQARGNDRAGARREAILGIGRQGQLAALQSAQMKAGEQIQARGQLGGALSDVRGTDTSVASHNADLSQSNQIFNAGNATDVSKYMAGLKAQVETGNADRSLGAGEFTAGQQNSRDIAGAGLRLDADTGNASRGLQADEFNATGTNTAARDNTAAGNERQEFRSSQGNAIAVGNANRLQTTNDKNADLRQGAAVSNQGADISSQQIRDAAAANLRSDALKAGDQSLDATKFGIGVNRDVSLGNAGATNTANTSSLNRLNTTVGGAVNAVSTHGAGAAVKSASAQTLAPPPAGGVPAGDRAVENGGGAEAVSSAQTLAPPPGQPPPAPQPVAAAQTLAQPASYGAALQTAVAAPAQPVPAHHPQQLGMIQPGGAPVAQNASYHQALQTAVAPPTAAPGSYASFLGGATGMDDEQKKRLGGMAQTQRMAA